MAEQETLTRKKAERITKLTVTTAAYDSPGNPEWLALGKDGEGDVLASGNGATEGKALNDLVEDNWRRVKRLVLDRDKWECVHCGSRSNLQVHHKKFRSHGRVDDPIVLESCCPACHERIHKGINA